MSDNLKHRTGFKAQHIDITKTTNSLPQSSPQTTQSTVGHISAAVNEPGISTTQTPQGQRGLRWDEPKLSLT